MKLLKSYIALVLLFLTIIIPELSRAGARPLNKTTTTKNLSKINWSGAGVFPFFYEHDKKYALLTRESRGYRKDKYTDFGGSREIEKTSVISYHADIHKGVTIDLSIDKHPINTAAREFWEEGILDVTLGLTPQEVQKYIDPSNTKTEIIIVYPNLESKIPNTWTVSYITNFTLYKNQFVDKFFTARRHAIDNKRVDQEDKNAIAFVEWGILQKTLQNAQGNSDTTITADTVITQTQDGHIVQRKNISITLDVSFVTMYAPFFKGEPFTQGENLKVRFYSHTQEKAPVSQQTSEQAPALLQ